MLVDTVPYGKRELEVFRNHGVQPLEADMDVQDILKQLEVNEGTFPREAVIEAIEQRGVITPELLRILEYVYDNAEV